MAIKKIQQISQILPEVQKDTLLLLDIGYTLIQPAGPMIGTAEGRKYLLSRFPIAKRESREELIKIATALAPEMEWKRCDADILETIKTVQKAGINLLAITGAGNNFIFKWPYFPKEGQMDQFQFFTSILKRAGIDMTLTAPQEPQLREVCDYLSAKYQDGILFTCGQPMSNILPHFLTALTQKYRKLVIVDDELDFLEQLQFSLQGTIEFLGMHYLNRSHPSPAFDAQIAEKQLRHFQKTGSLLGDEMAFKIYGDK